MKRSKTALLLLLLCAVPLFGQDAPGDKPSVTVQQTVTAKKDAANQQAGQVEGYRALDAVTATRTSTKLETVPQAVQVMTHALIEDQNPVSFDELLANVSGIQGRNRTEFNNGAYQIRGFQFSQIQFDGLPLYDNGADPDSLINVERVEVLKGPGSLLYGGGAGDGVGAAVGGTVNLVYKQPTQTPFINLATTFGNQNRVHPTLDANQPLDRDGKILLRVTGEFESSDHFIEGFERERSAVYPTLRYQPDSRQQLTLQIASVRRRQSDYAGLPAVGTVAGDFRTDPETFIGSNQPKNRSETDSVTLCYQRLLNEAWTTQVAVRSSETTLEQPGFFVFGGDPLPGTVSVFPLGSGFLGRNYEEVTAQPTLSGSFHWGTTRHTLLIGADFTRIKDDSESLFDVPLQMIDLANPILPDRPQPSGTFSQTRRDNRYQTQALYVQDQIELGGGVHLLLGLRGTRAQLDVQPENGAGFETTSEKVTPRFGLTWQVTEALSLFSGYGEGFRQVPFVTTEAAPEPETSDQWELGLKLNSRTGLSGSLVAYRLDRNQVATPDPANPFFQIQTGLQRSSGIELDLLWQHRGGFSLLAAYAYQDAAIEADTLFAAGNRLIGVPRNSGRLWGRWTALQGPLRGLELGLGLSVRGKQAVDLNNRWFTDGFETLDALISRRWGRYRLALNGKNLTDELTFEPYQYLFGEVTPGDGRTVNATLGVTF